MTSFPIPAFTLTGSGSSGWISIVSSGLAALPPGQRVDPTMAASMATISSNSGPGVRFASGAKNYYLAGLNIGYSASAANPQTGALFDFSGSSNCILDRSCVVGSPVIGSTADTMQCQRAIATNSNGAVTVMNSYALAHSTTQDSQAICGWASPGPWLIKNNYLAGAAENILIGGADNASAAQNPVDITITGNSIIKPLAWQSTTPNWFSDDKNLLELKNASRILIDGNIFQNNFAGGQAGFGIDMWSVDQGGTAPWSVTQNVTFTNNTLINSLHGINLLASWGTVNTPANNINISNNLLYNIGGNGTSGGRLFQVVGGVNNLSITNNTAINSTGAYYWALGFDGGTSANFNFSNNIVSAEGSGVWGSGVGLGSAALAAYAPGATVKGNVFIGGTASQFAPNPGNFFPASVAFDSNYGQTVYPSAGYMSQSPASSIILPQAQAPSAIPTVTGRTWACSTNAQLQAALAGSVAGDQIVLAAGVVFSPFTITAK